MTEYFAIEDGHNIDGKVERSPGVHPEAAFTYRPALMAERQAFMKATAEFGKRTEAAAALVKKHVTAWGLTYRDGKEIPLDPAAIAKLQPSLLDRIVDVILGYAPSGEEAADAKN